VKGVEKQYSFPLIRNIPNWQRITQMLAKPDAAVRFIQAHFI
jgi:hypothetical protein